VVKEGAAERRKLCRAGQSTDDVSVGVVTAELPEHSSQVAYCDSIDLEEFVLEDVDAVFADFEVRTTFYIGRWCVGGRGSRG